MEGLEMKYFFLKPKGDDIYALASRLAIRRYARVISAENPKLAEDLKEWVNSETLNAVTTKGEKV